MTFWTLDRVGAALRDLLDGPKPGGSTALTGVSTDSRRVAPGELFVALVGERFDAHDFLADAVAKGAAALVVSRPKAAAGLGVPIFIVDDTTIALGALGQFRRRAWGSGRPVVAIAGSNGKTGTKEMVRAALGSVYEVHATTGNLNNQVGVPLTLLALPDHADVAVIEIGTNHPGEVALLRDIVLPDLAVVTSVGEEHLEGFGDLAGVLAEETAVFRDVAVGITPASQPEIGDAARALARRVEEAGLESGDVRAHAWALDERGHAVVTLEEGGVTCRVPIPGAHNARNAMLAIAVARLLGVSDADAARGIASMPALPMRSAWEEHGTLQVLNDAYNSNPASARAALALFDELSTDRPRVIVLGTMLELGASSSALHDDVARLALRSRAHVIAGVGEFARAFRDTGKGDSRVVVADDVEELWSLLQPRLASGAMVLLKGSRGMRLERLLPRLATIGAERISHDAPATPRA